MNDTYYLFKFEPNSIYDLITYNANRFYLYATHKERYNSSYELNAPPVFTNVQPADKKDLLEKLDELIDDDSYERWGYYAKLYPANFKLSGDYDVFTIGGRLIVPEYVKNDLERALPDKLEFLSVQELNIQMDDALYAKRKAQYAVSTEPVEVRESL